MEFLGGSTAHCTNALSASSICHPLLLRQLLRYSRMTSRKLWVSRTLDVDVVDRSSRRAALKLTYDNERLSNDPPSLSPMSTSNERGIYLRIHRWHAPKRSWRASNIHTGLFATIEQSYTSRNIKQCYTIPTAQATPSPSATTPAGSSSTPRTL